jgi:hypothetical protein
MDIVLSDKGFGRSPDRATACSGYPKPPVVAISGMPGVDGQVKNVMIWAATPGVRTWKRGDAEPPRFAPRI